MVVHIAPLRLGGLVDAPVDQFRALAKADRVRTHRLTEDPASADLILYPQCHMLSRDWRLNAIRNSGLATQFPDRVMVYDERDRPWSGLPGIYVSMPSSSFDRHRQKAWGYAGFATRNSEQSRVKPDLLFSLVASPTHPSREPLFRLVDADAVVERVRGFVFYDPASTDFEKRKQRFRTTLLRSRFVLCPRGTGTSSVRLYETMAAGRVPVIISDEWVAPDGPAWQQFSIRWPEGQTDGLIDALHTQDRNWSRMSTAARQAYEEYFAPDMMFHRIVERCSELLVANATSRPVPSPWRSRAGRAAARHAAIASARRKASRLRVRAEDSRT
jgi:hypothetical protein